MDSSDNWCGKRKKFFYFPQVFKCSDLDTVNIITYYLLFSSISIIPFFRRHKSIIIYDIHAYND